MSLLTSLLRPSGRTKALLVLGGLAGTFLVFGAQDIYEVVNNPQPVKLSCGEFTRSRPAASWVTLTGCDPALADTSYAERKGKVTALYVPVRPTGADEKTPATMVFALKGDQLLEKANGVGNDQSKALMLVLSLAKEFAGGKPVTGMVRFGLRDESDVRDHVAGSGQVAANIAVIDVGRSPDMVSGIGFAAFGGICLVLFVVVLKWQKDPEPAHQAEAAVAARVAAVSHLGLGLMLDQHSRFQLTPGEEDGDATLGDVTQVRRRIAEILPGVTFDVTGRGSFGRAEYSLKFDTGTSDPVRLVTVDVQGGNAATPAVERLITKTGWNFVPEGTAALAS